MASTSHSRISSMHRPLRLSRFALSHQERARPAYYELERSANGNRARERRWPTAGVHRAGAHATDRAGAPWTTPVQPSLRLSAAGAAERPRARAKPCRGRAPARARCARDLPGWTNCLLALITPADDIKSSLIVEDLAARAPVGNSRAKALLLRKAELAAEQERLEAHRHEPCAFVPGAPLAARRRRPRFSF